MSKNVYNRIYGTSAAIASGAAATAVAYTFSADTAPCVVTRLYGTTPNYTNSVNTTLFIVQGQLATGVGTVMWSGTATAKATVINELVSGGKSSNDGMLVFPGDTIAVVAAADIGATGANTMTVSAHIIQ